METSVLARAELYVYIQSQMGHTLPQNQDQESAPFLAVEVAHFPE